MVRVLIWRFPPLEMFSLDVFSGNFVSEKLPFLFLRALETISGYNAFRTRYEKLDMKVILVDASAVLYRSFFALPEMTSPSKEPSQALFGFAKALCKLLVEQRPTHMIALMDGPEGKEPRKELYSEYKAHRESTPEELLGQIDQAPFLCEALGVFAYKKERLEADDLIASCVRQSKEWEPTSQIYICTQDKDLFQLLDEQTRCIYLPKQYEILDAEAVKAKYGVTPTQFADYQAIVGDGSDNIPGVAGIGAKGASDLLAQFGSLDQLYARLEENPALLGGSKRDKLLAGKEMAFLSRSLTQLDPNAPVPPMEEWLFHYDAPGAFSRWEEFCKRWGFRSSIDAAKKIFSAPKSSLASIKEGDSRGTRRAKGLERGAKVEQEELFASPISCQEGAQMPEEMQGDDQEVVVFDRLLFSAQVEEFCSLDRASFNASTSLSKSSTTSAPIVDQEKERSNSCSFQVLLTPIEVKVEEQEDQKSKKSWILHLLSDPFLRKVLTDLPSSRSKSSLPPMHGFAAPLTEHQVIDHLEPHLVDPPPQQAQQGDLFSLKEEAKKQPPLEKFWLIEGEEALRSAFELLDAVGAQQSPKRIDVMMEDAKALHHLLLASGSVNVPQVWDLSLLAYCLGEESGGDRFTASSPEFSLSYFARQSTKTMGWARTLFQKLSENRPLMAFYGAVENPLVCILVKMEHEGIVCSKEVLTHLSQEVGEHLREIVEHIDALVAKERAQKESSRQVQQHESERELQEGVNLNSPKQLAALLYDELGLKPKKKKKTLYSTDAETLKSLEGKHPIIGHLLHYRMLEKLRSTYIDALGEHIEADGRIHPTLDQKVTATGRLSCHRPNLQNIPIRHPQGRAIRRAFLPREEEEVLVSFDYSQIELRLLAHFSQDAQLLDAFAKGKDVHRATAAQIYGVEEKSVSALERSRAKAVNFGIIYGQSAFGLSKQLQISRQEAGDFIARYFATYPQIEIYLQSLPKEARSKGYATTLMGRRRSITELFHPSKQIQAAGERMAVNTPIQGSAAEIIKMAMGAIAQREELLQRDGAALLLQIHDELLFSAARLHLQRLISWVKEAMEQVVTLRVPLIVNVKIGNNWEEC